jgi:hypothetical protein
MRTPCIRRKVKEIVEPPTLFYTYRAKNEYSGGLRLQSVKLVSNIGIFPFEMTVCNASPPNSAVTINLP